MLCLCRFSLPCVPRMATENMLENSMSFHAPQGQMGSLMRPSIFPGWGKSTARRPGTESQSAQCRYAAGKIASAAIREASQDKPRCQDLLEKN